MLLIATGFLILFYFFVIHQALLVLPLCVRVYIEYRLRMSTTSSVAAAAVSAVSRNPAKYFIRPDVMQILVQVTGFDMSRIFKPSFNPKQKQSEIQLLTKAQLNQVSARARVSLVTIETYSLTK